MKTYFVDSFTREKFKGNPAAVCIAESVLTDTQMQNIATEIGFSETAFINKISGNRFHIRFFTPKQEIPLCGHATLAASKIIFDTEGGEHLIFLNVENLELPITRAGEKIVLQFPVYTTTPATVPEAVFAALGITEWQHTRYCEKHRIIMIEIADANLLAALAPDFTALLKAHTGINGVLVTAAGNDNHFDFHYRYFWPWAGTNEDPVTGGVQTFLTAYWAEKLNKTKLNAFQSSLRTGQMNTELVNGSVRIYGEAVVVLEGTLNI